LSIAEKITASIQKVDSNTSVKNKQTYNVTLRYVRGTIVAMEMQ